MTGLTNKVVIITGGAAGIGRAAANLFVEIGARVVITGRQPEKLKRVAESRVNIDFIVADAAMLVLIPADGTPTLCDLPNAALVSRLWTISPSRSAYAWNPSGASVDHRYTSSFACYS